MEQNIILNRRVLGGVRIPNEDDVQQWKKFDLTFYILRLVLHVIKVEFE